MLKKVLSFEDSSGAFSAPEFRGGVDNVGSEDRVEVVAVEGAGEGRLAEEPEEEEAIVDKDSEEKNKSSGD